MAADELERGEHEDRPDDNADYADPAGRGGGLGERDAGEPNPGLGAVRVGEPALGILRRGGFTSDQAVAAFSGIIALNYGWSSFTTARDLHPDSPGDEVGAMLASPARPVPAHRRGRRRDGRLRQRPALRVRARPALGRASRRR
jgi:hypothetical protein